MGTPLFAVPILKSIFQKGYDIHLVYTQPPSKSNRGHKLSKSPIHKFCEANDLKVRTPENFKLQKDKLAFFDLNAALTVVVAYGLIYP